MKEKFCYLIIEMFNEKFGFLTILQKHQNPQMVINDFQYKIEAFQVPNLLRNLKGK